MLVSNTPFAIDHVSLRHTIDTPLDTGFVLKSNPMRAWIAEFVQPIDRRLALVFPIDGVNIHIARLGQLHPADAPHGTAHTKRRIR